MQCQLCGKRATVHLTEIIDGQKVEQHLCEQCAQSEGITIKQHVPISSLLNDLVEAQRETKELTSLSCPQCDLSWSEFRKSGLLGCPNDYAAFEKPLLGLIERAHEGAVTHIGRVPENPTGKLSQQLKLLRFRQDLHRAIKEEDYETAAHLRDEISKYETN
jgi:protein arginine kinase activator